MNDVITVRVPNASRRRRACGVWLLLWVLLQTFAAHAQAADDARQIVEESQKRTRAASQRYEGVLQVFDAKGKVSDKRWTLERLGSHGASRMVLRFTQPAEVKGDDTIDGVVMWKIQSTPRQGKSSQYTKSTVWIRKDNYAFARIENLVKDQVVRRLNYLDIQNVQGIWTAKQLEMTDLTRSSRTRLTLDKLQYNVPTHADDFTLQAIRRQ